jgi:hypothetical protein
LPHHQALNGASFRVNRRHNPELCAVRANPEAPGV